MQKAPIYKLICRFLQNLKIMQSFKLYWNIEKMWLKYSLRAYYLHPAYYQEAASTLNNNYIANFQEFIIENLDVNGITSLSQYQKGQEVTNPIALWTMCSGKHKQLASFALQLLEMSEFSAEVKRFFSQRACVHCPIRNRLDFETWKILAYIYYT